MKKTFFAMTAFFAAAFALAETPVYFRSEGPDRYADGTVVQDGEIYALVWSRTNSEGTPVSEFAMDSTGKILDANNHEVLARAPIAKDGGCPLNAYLLDNNEVALLSSGTFSVYLLDTRMRSSEGGDVSVGLGGSDGFICNGYETVPEASITVGTQSVVRSKSGNGGFTGDSADATAVPNGTPTPAIVDIAATDGAAVVKVDDTVPSIQYALLAYEELDGEPVNLANGVNGNADESIYLSTENPKYRFFKVVRSDLKGGNQE